MKSSEAPNRIDRTDSDRLSVAGDDIKWLRWSVGFCTARDACSSEITNRQTTDQMRIALEGSIGWKRSMYRGAS